ncbi:MAG TPA: ABC transporter permease [Actinomycetes bacterium]|jgi:ABC-2 type transport system permease protein|nr:ABC transporter permease [Actinomycetes bacterium]
MTATLTHSWFMSVRHLRNLVRQPWWVAITLAQPIIWIVLFGALFKRIVEIPGFGGGSYITFLTPGIVIMTALFSGGWNGMTVIQDMDRGVMDRFLVSPARRGSLISGRLAYQAAVTVVQSLILIGLGLLLGARFPGGVAGAAVLLVCAVLLGSAVGALCDGLALLVRNEGTLIAAVQLVLLPLVFLSSGFMQQRLVPGWIQAVARYNPVNWAVQAGREALGASVDWGLVLTRGGWLLAFTAACGWLATGAFRAYQRSV